MSLYTLVVHSKPLTEGAVMKPVRRMRRFVRLVLSFVTCLVILISLLIINITLLSSSSALDSFDEVIYAYDVQVFEMSEQYEILLTSLSEKDINIALDQLDKQSKVATALRTKAMKLQEETMPPEHETRKWKRYTVQILALYETMEQHNELENKFLQYQLKRLDAAEPLPEPENDDDTKDPVDVSGPGTAV